MKEQVRCPICHQMACEVEADGYIAVRCQRCKHDYYWFTAAGQAKLRQQEAESAPAPSSA